jgi:diguanylate cyclase (GGDEF)-like protein
VFAQVREAGDDLALIMIDVDYFKSLNDTLGHRAGDEVIRFVGELLRQCVREEDLAIRYGGDEFLLVLPGLNAAMATKVADRIVKLFGQQARLLAVEPKPGMSAGVASLKEHRPGNPPAFLQMADQALYQAKKLGKARVCVYRAGAMPVLTA